QDPISGVADSAGSPNNFYLKGVVQSPDLTTSGLNFSIKDSTGSIIVTSSNDVSGYTPKIGDSIELRGILVQNEGLTAVIADSISILNNESPAIVAQLVTDLNESFEANLLKLDHYFLVDKNQWVPKANGFSVDITNGNDTLAMFINDNTDLYDMKAPDEEFNLTGIEI